MICSKEKCVGCFACFNICPKNAIEMKEDEHGFIYPIINQEKCINCGLCKKVCPSINNISYYYPQKCFATYVKDKLKRKQSTSGGVATVLSEYILNHDGIVYGTCFEKGIRINHIRVDNIKDLDKLKGSKYVHSYIMDTYKLAKKDLLEDKKVLFIGTPCQIAGLKNFLSKDYENLYCVDLICHGVPSQQYLKDELKELNDIDNISFRGDYGYRLKCIREGKIVIDKPMINSKYYTGFMKSLFYRENCYTCQYAKPERVSDITIGDFWGLKSDSKLYENGDKGISVVLPITEKGMRLFEECKNVLEYEEREISEAVEGNTQLRHPSIKTKKYNIFYKNYIKYGFDKSYNKAMKIQNIKNILKKNELINKIYKKLKG